MIYAFMYRWSGNFNIQSHCLSHKHTACNFFFFFGAVSSEFTEAVQQPLETRHYTKGGQTVKIVPLFKQIASWLMRRHKSGINLLISLSARKANHGISHNVKHNSLTKSKWNQSSCIYLVLYSMWASLNTHNTKDMINITHIKSVVLLFLLCSCNMAWCMNCWTLWIVGWNILFIICHAPTCALQNNLRQLLLACSLWTKTSQTDL